MILAQSRGVQEGEATEVHDDRLRRLYRYWLDRKGNRRFPCRRDIDPAHFTYVLGDVMLVDVLRDPLRFRVRVHGTNMALQGRYDLTGKLIDDLPIAEYRDYVLQRCAGLVRNGKPLAVRYERVWELRPCRYEALWLPLSDDETNVTALLCAMDYHVYRARAAELRQRAQTAQDPVVFRELLALAAEYDRLAEDAEHQS